MEPALLIPLIENAKLFVTGPLIIMAACMRIKYNCKRGEFIFSNNGGCGCAKPIFCTK